MASNNLAQQNSLTLAQFLDWVATEVGHYEFHAGEIVAMAGGTTRDHDEIAVQLVIAVGNHLGRSSPCRVHSNALAVRVEANDRVHFPDLHVTCDPRDHAERRTTRNPCLIVEVLSETTRDYDQGDKFRSYKQIESLSEYLLVDTSEQGVVLHRRAGAREWRTFDFGPDDTFLLESIGLTVTVAVLYERTDVPAPRPQPRLVASEA